MADELYSLLHQILSGVITPTVAGRMQEKSTTIDLHQAAGTYDLFTDAVQTVLLESLVIQMPVGIPAGVLTSISIQTNDATPAIIIDLVAGDVANLTSKAQLGWSSAINGPIRIEVGKKIQLTIAGGAAAAAYICNVNAEYRAVVSGGTL